MEHLAIMKKSWGLLPKILNGQKTIESRWYKNKYAPWNKIKKGDTVYFKNSGEPVTIKSNVADVLQFSDLTPIKVKEILIKYGRRDGISENETMKYYEMFKDKNYCLLVFLKNHEKIDHFNVDKKGFGSMSAWITIKNIKEIKQ